MPATYLAFLFCSYLLLHVFSSILPFAFQCAARWVRPEEGSVLKATIPDHHISYFLTSISSIPGIILSLTVLLTGATFNLSVPFHGGPFDVIIDLLRHRDTASSPVLYFTIDSLAAFFLLVLSVLSLFVTLFSTGYVKSYAKNRNGAVLCCLYNLFILSIALVILSGNMIIFLLSWEIMSLLSYFLVCFEHDAKDAVKAGTISAIMTHAGTVFIITAFMMIYSHTGSLTFQHIQYAIIPPGIKNIIFICLLIGFGTKAGLVPAHVWLPYANPAAPTNISALMSGIMEKTAVYAFVRVVFGFAEGFHMWWGLAVLITGSVSAVLGIAYALVTNNLKKLLTYSTVENMGIIMIGTGLAIISRFMGYAALSAFALMGTLFHVFNHSLFKGLLFMGAGAVKESTGTHDMEKLGGLIKTMPVTALCFLVGSLGAAAMPFFSGFASEWTLYQSFFHLLLNTAYEVHIPVIVITVVLSAATFAMASALAAACFVKAFGITFLALPRSGEAARAREASPQILVAMVCASLLCISAGLFPGPFTDISGRAADSILTGGIPANAAGRYEDRSSTFANPAGQLPSLAGGQENRADLAVNPTGALKVPNDGGSTVLLPVFVLLMSVLIGLGAYLLSRTLKKDMKIRVYNTWDCGFTALNSRMEYTGTGFTKPLRIVFRALYLPGRKTRVEEGVTPYHQKSIHYHTSTQHIFEKYLYTPLINSLLTFSRKARITIQTGSIHTYLVYIFGVILVLFIYYTMY